MFDLFGTRALERAAQAVRLGVHARGRFSGSSCGTDSVDRHSPPGWNFALAQAYANERESDREGYVHDDVCPRMNACKPVSNLMSAGAWQPCAPRRMTVSSRSDEGLSREFDARLAQQTDTGRLRA